MATAACAMWTLTKTREKMGSQLPLLVTVGYDLLLRVVVTDPRKPRRREDLAGAKQARIDTFCCRHVSAHSVFIMFPQHSDREIFREFPL